LLIWVIKDDLMVHKVLRATVLLPLAVLLFGGGFSAMGAWWLADELQGRAAVEFQRYAQRVGSELERRFQMPVYGLHGARSIFAASNQVNRSEFRAAITSRDMPQEFPGVRGFGFIQWLKRADVPSFLAAERADGAPQFSIRALDNLQRDDLYVIKFIEPLAKNMPALGLDIGSEAVRRAGAQQAVDTGQATISGAITLVQDTTKTPGVLLFVPLYGKHAVLSTVAERRAALVGLLYAPLVINELLADMADVTAQQIDFELFDAPSSMPRDALLFDADEHLKRVPADAQAQRLFKSTSQLVLPGRVMTLQVNSTPQFEAAIDQLSPWLLLFAGILLSSFLALLLHQLASARGKAEALARNMTLDLERLAIVVRKTSNAVVITDRQRRITWVNAGFERISGFTAAEALGCSPGQLLQCAATSAETVARMRSALNTGQGFSGEVLNRTKAGQQYLIELEIQPLHDDMGALSGFMAIESDITERRAEQLRLEAALRDNAALLGTLNQHTIISVADRAGRIVEVNDAFCRISGYSRAELLGENHRMVNSGVHTAEFWLAMWAAISRGEPWHAVVCNRAKNGALYWVDTTIAAFMGHDGKIEKYISIRIDISAAKSQEISLRMARDQLAKATDVAQLGIWTWDLRSNTVLLDKRMRELYGFALERTDAESFRIHWRSRVHPDDLKATEAELQGAIAGAGSFEPNFRIYSADGSIRFIQSAGMVEYDESGNALLVMGINRDITAQHDAEALLREAKSAADEANRAKSEFLANMSHELRTPMNAILGMLTLLGKTELSSKQADYAAKSEGAARSLLGLLNEILDFSKIEAGKMTLDPQPFALDQLLRELSMILSSNLNSKQVELLFEIDPRLPRQLYGDGMRLQQVLINLGGNAVKFTEQGEVRLAIKVLALDAAKVTVQFAVSDTGIGIAEKNQQLIFSGFTQAEASITRRFGGTGLGVAISQSLVALMGGELKLTSALGQGSRFYFTLELPLAVANPDQPGLPAPASKALRALLVDDHASVRELLKRMAESLGWEVTLADSGERALTLLQAQQAAGKPFEVIFIDWQMPGLDGWQTSQLIRERLPAPFAPLIVMVTAHQREMLLQRSAADQALLDGFLVKPVTASMLFDALMDAQAKQAPSTLGRLSPAPESQRLAGMRLLLVEDNLNNQQIACELLEGEGANVAIANHGQEALEILAANAAAFDLVLMDLQMPVMDGLTATRHIRQNMGLQQLPIVAMTANAMQSDREACEAAGMNEHVGKPFDLHHLVAVLRQQVGRQTLPVATPIAAALSDSGLPSTVSQAAVLAGVNLEQALQFMAGQQELYERLLPMFLENLVAIPEQLHALLAQGDTQSASRLLHSLKGLAGQMGASALALEAAKGEKLLAGTPPLEQAAAAAEHACSVIMQATPGLMALQQAFATQQTAEAQASLPGESIDRPALRAALGTLMQLLENSDMQALADISRLQRQFAPTLNEPLSALASAINALAFEQAQALCTALLAEHAV
jgi:PAS domain S-box-containing protein